MNEDKRYTLVVQFDVTGQLACLSHQETSRMFERAFLRAEVPARYSEGFNPRLRMSLPFPRTVGIESIGDLLVLLIDGEDADSQSLMQSISSQLPAGCSISGMDILEGKVSYQPQWCQYSIAAEGIGDDQNVRQKLASVNQAISTGGSVFVDRYWPKKRINKKVDVCQYLESLELDRNRIVACVKVTQAGSVRVEELLEISGVEREKITGGITRSNVRFVRR